MNIDVIVNKTQSQNVPCPMLHCYLHSSVAVNVLLVTEGHYDVRLVFCCLVIDYAVKFSKNISDI